MNLKALRTDRGWSQEQLSQMSKPGMELLKSLAAVFEVDIHTLQQETPMTNTETLSNENIVISTEEKDAAKKVKRLKKFYSSLLSYVATIGFLFIINLITSPGYIWTIWVALGWGLSIALQAVKVFEVFSFFDDDWEKREIEKRMKK
jgi:transcriptional regulator with XRE-family HTH domain